MHGRRRSRSADIGIVAKGTIVLMAGIFGFGLCEIGLRLVSPAPPVPGREPQLLYQANPDAGFLHVPNQMGWLDDGLATINAIGLRGTLPEMPKPAGALRIMTIGDSTTFGWGVGDSETYGAELERLLVHEFPDRKVHVVNAGVAAYDLKHAAKLLKSLAPRLTPDLVLVGVFWNDLPFERTSPDGEPQTAAPQAPDAGAGGAPSQPFRLGNQPSGWNRLLRSSRVLYTLRHAWLAAIAPTSAANNQVRWEMALLEGLASPAIQSAWADVKASLTEIRDLGAAGGYPVGVVIMPIRAQVENDYTSARYQTEVRSIAESLGMFVIDPLPLFKVQPNLESLFIPYDRIHYSPRGNAEVADAVFSILRTRPEFQPGPVPYVP